MSAQELLSELGLDGPLTFGPGRRAKPLRATYAGELTVEDLLAARGTEVVQKAVPLNKLRGSHHTLARVLAQGIGTVEAAAITGYTPERISVLKADPAFSELLAYYKSMEARQYAVARADMHERLAAIGFDALETLHEKLLETPEAFDNKTLLAIVEASSDRTGHGKTSTVNHDHSHALSEATITAIKSASVADRSAVSEDDRRALLRLTVERTAPELPEVTEAEWSEVGGDQVREASEEASGEPLGS